MNRPHYIVLLIQSVRFRILLACSLFPILFSSCQDSTGPKPEPEHSGDYWPLKVGNSWTFSYRYTFFDINQPYFPSGTYEGDLTWQVTDSAAFQDSSTFVIKQNFMGTASEKRQQPVPPYQYDSTYSIHDSSATFEVSIKDGLIRISKNASTAVWGNTFLLSLFQIADVHRYPVSPSMNDSISYGRNVTQYDIYWITLKQFEGPLRVECKSGYVHSTKRVTAELKSRVVTN